jgi:hypothetical protein
MDLNEFYTLLNFYINKEQGGWYAPEEITRLVVRAQTTLYNTYYTKYSTSQRLDDALAPFKVDYQFTIISSPDGLITTPADYLDLLGIYTIVIGSDNIARKKAVEIVNEEELVIRLNSQVVPVTPDDPIGIIKADWNIQLYPDEPQAGIMMYLREPVAPYYAYSVVSGRVIVYDQANSVQLEWSDKDQETILLIALNGLGINLSEADILQWSELKTQQNFTSTIKL